MTWPVNATRAEVLRILETNRDQFHHWVISREETEVVLTVIQDLRECLTGAHAVRCTCGEHNQDGDIRDPRCRELQAMAQDRVPQGTEGGEAE